ncbi:MAG: phage tail tape measure protein, partial [Ruminiclostridium sp.]
MADGKVEFEVRADSSKLEADLSAAQKTVDRAAQKTEKAVEEIGQAAEKIGKTVSESNKKAADAIKDVGKEADTTKSKIDGLGSEASESAKKNEALKEELSKVKQELGNVKGELEDVKRKTQETDNATGNLTNSMGKMKSSVADAGKTIGAIAGTAGTALAAMGTAAVKSAAEAETSFAKVKTLLASGTDTGAYYDELKAASKRSGVDMSSLSESVYGAISASVAQEDAIAFTENAVKLAKGGFTQTATAVDVLTTAINAYGMSAEDATHISDVLITTQNLGKTTVDELARSMGQTIPIANSSGAAIEDLSAQYAVLTKNGVATAEAGTGIKAMLSELNSSSSNISKTLKELTGSSFSELQASGKNTAEILQILNEHAGSAGQKLSDLFGSVEAGSAALTLVKDGGADFNNVLAQMENSAGATEKAYDIMANTIEERFNRVKNKLSIAFTEVGEELMPEIEKIVDYIDENSDEIADTIKDIGKAAGEAVEFLAGLAEALWDNKEAVAAAVVGLASFKVAMSIGNVISATAGAINSFRAVTDSATKSQLALNAAGAANPFVLIASVVAGAVAAVATFAATAESCSDKINKMRENAEDLIETSKKYIEKSEDLSDVAEKYDEVYNSEKSAHDKGLELEALQDRLTQQYGPQASGIDLVNGKYEDQIGLLDTLIEKNSALAKSSAIAAYNEYLSAEKEESGISYSNRAGEFDAFGKTTSTGRALKDSAVQEALRAVAENNSSVTIGSDFWSDFIVTVSGNTEE